MFKIVGKSSHRNYFCYNCTILATSLYPAFFLDCLNLEDGNDAIPKRRYPITTLRHVTSKNSDDPNYTVAETSNLPNLV